MSGILDTTVHDRPFATDAPSREGEPPALIAPVWHTVVMLCVCVFWTFAAARHQQHSRLPPQWAREGRYIATIVWQLLLVLFIWFGIRRRGHTLGELVAGRWPTWRAALRDAKIAVLFYVFLLVALGALSFVLGANQYHSDKLLALIPHTALERVTWCFTAVVIGFCEELIFRGYFMRQFAALAKGERAGGVLQAALFGFGHLYQGPRGMIVIGVEGFFLGELARRRRSLRPGMIAHGLQDLIAGLAASAVKLR